MKPILFNTEMVRAILEGRKTVTRRLIKPRYRDDEYGWTVCINSYTHLVDDVAYTDGDGACTRSMKPPYRAGDILYVRETWIETSFGYVYRASDYSTIEDWAGEEIKWKPSIFMPKEAARIFLQVTDVRAERLQDITAEDCKREGIYDNYKTTSDKYHELLISRAYPKTFSMLWDSTIKKKDLDEYGWSANPWVWVIEFEMIESEVEE